MKQFLIIGLIALCSCATERQARKYYQKHPEELAHVCEREFPRNDSVGESIITFRPGRSGDSGRATRNGEEMANTSLSVGASPPPDGHAVWNKRDVGSYPTLVASRAGRAKCIPDTIIIETPHYYEKPSAKINAAYIRELEKGNAVLVDKLASKNKWLWRLGIPLAGFVLTTILLIIFKIKS